MRVREMRNASIIQAIHQTRGAKGLPLERVYRHLFDPDLFLRAYGKIYRNFGAMTRGTTEETVDGMDLQKINTIIGLLRMERYRWTPVRRTYIEKACGKLRPLGIPTWSDKLVQEVLRLLLEPYYEQRFSDLSHGFRPHRSCHTALRQICNRWKGTVWFIEGDIKGCFDNIDHQVLLDIIRRDIHDGRLVELIAGLLRAGYMENWRYYDTFSGTPQGGIISPLLANVYLNELDRFVEDTLIPAYTKGDRRKENPDYNKLKRQIAAAKRRGDSAEANRLRRECHQMSSSAPSDPDHRRLRYNRYADDFILGFVGPKAEADDICRQIGEFLEQRLHLTLSPEKTLITHAGDKRARFLGYEISVVRHEDLITDGRRATNGVIRLSMPRQVVTKYLARFSKKGKIRHQTVLLPEKVYTIIQRYQSVLQGVYNFYCMAVNVSVRMNRIDSILKTSLLKTLACKFRSTVKRMRRKFRVVTPTGRTLQVIVQRSDKAPLIAVYGGIPFERNPEGQGAADYTFGELWHQPATSRTEVVQRLLAGKCELCEWKGAILAHHIRKLADLDRPGRQPKAPWEKVMAARRRKTLMVCTDCHKKIHAGRYDGRSL
jgi:group II intron reverse transcriptase/maturase